MPKRLDILNAFVTALGASTSISYVTRDMTENGFGWAEDRYPGVMVIDGNEKKKRFAFPDSTNEDMESELSIEVTGWVRQLFSSTDTLEEKRGALLAEIERVAFASSDINAVVLDITGVEADTDRNVLENIGWVVTRFDVSYIYNHGSP